MITIHRMTLSALAIVALLVSVPGSASAAQKAPLKQQITGTWTLVSNATMRPDGTKYEPFGGNTKGMMILDRGGHIVLVLTGDARRKFASNNRMEGSPEENKAQAQGSNSFYGRYSVDEKAHALVIHIDACSFANWDGTDQTRPVSLSGDRLTWKVAAASGGGSAELVWKRAK